MAEYPVQLRIQPHTRERNRLTTAFRLLLGLPHLLLAGGPLAIALTWSAGSSGSDSNWAAGGGLLGAVAALSAVVAWFAILFTREHPRALWYVGAFYLSWRARSGAYLALLRDEYPPFGESPYPSMLDITRPTGPRDRLTVGFRLILALPHVFAIWVLGIAWCFATVAAWFAILFTGNYPETLYDFAVAVFRWNLRAEAYILLLTDEYPPFTLESP